MGVLEVNLAMGDNSVANCEVLRTAVVLAILLQRNCVILIRLCDCHLYE